jgi:predicted heme/steroid binding protein
VRYGAVPGGLNENFGDEALPPPVPESNPLFKIISFSLAGFNGISFDRYSKLTDGVYQLADTFTWVKGRHTLKFGADIRQWQDNLTSGNPYSMSFDGRFTGNPVADMLRPFRQAEITPKILGDRTRAILRKMTGA